MRKYTTKDLCLIAMLIAVTAVLAFVSGKLRIGMFSKFSFNFISVYITAVLFGPVVAGLVGVAGDFISAIGTGPYLWMIGAVEFLYGVIFGLLFYENENHKSGFVIKTIVATVIIGAVDIFIKSYILMSVGFAPTPLNVAIATRLPMVAVMMVLRFAVLLVIDKSLSRVVIGLRK